MNKAVWTAAALALACSLPAAAQEEMCTGVPAAYTNRCITALQGADAAVPQLGLLVAGGSPGFGIGGRASGPAVRASLRANAVRLALPNFIIETNPSPPPTNTEEMRAFGVVLAADASFRVIPAVDLLASVSLLPLDLLGRETFNPSSSQVALGAGVRATVLRESAGMPGVALSAMYRRAGSIQIGTACERGERADPGSTTTPPTTLCDVTGDVSQATFEVAGISSRVLVSKGVGGFGLGLGLGYDVYDGDVRIDLLGAPGTVASPTRIYHTPTGELSSGRFSAFLNAAREVSGGRGAVVAEVGWMQGGDRIDGFTEESDFDPGRGTVFGSFGGRFGLGAAGAAPGVQGQPPVPGAPAAARPPVRRRDVITREEMVDAGVTNLFEAVQRLRPEWLRGANLSNLAGSGQELVVYQNQTPLGGVEELRELTPEYAASLRFLDGPTASNTLPGLGSRRVAGAIVIVTPGAARN